MSENTDITIDGSTLAQAIVDAFTSPKKVEVDGQKVENHSIAELVEAHKYLASAGATAKKGSGVKFGKFSHSGSL